eukprot:TRINITY_DN11311_c0_g1_i1.p1 TRINITY_DN11311_c0_g1~~TRINITY_DN11311_c0_g1_i1.p1  ORF type:complete len:417 (+),score=51.95 TRINITY_DN11311_c0_g1_i1:64-1314(+)
MFESITAIVQGNPYFHAGAGLYGIGAAMMFARTGGRLGKEYFKRRFLTTVEVTNRDPAYQWVIEWIAKHHGESYLHKSIMTSNLIVHANDSVSAKMRYVPSPGTHFFIHGSRFYWVKRSRQIEKTHGTDVLETVQIGTLGSSWQAIDDILQQASNEASILDEHQTVIYTTTGSKWVRFQDPRTKKPLQSVVLPADKKPRILRDISRFLSDRSWYEGMGIPYRRGYLLYGPPGCGKSSFVLGLAGELSMAICILSLSNRHLDDEGLVLLLNTAPQRSIVLLEDVDRAFSNDSRVTISGLLNSIDGVAAQEGRLLFLTTNHIDKLDDALIRPGRCDVKLLFPNSTPYQQQMLFLRFFPNQKEASIRFVDAIAQASRIANIKDGPSMAALQGHLFSFRESADECIASIPEFIEGETLPP